MSGMLYFTDANGVYSANPDGTNFMQLVTGTSDPNAHLYDPPGFYLGYPTDIAVDPINQKIYWNSHFGFIRSADIDGTNIETLVFQGSGLGTPGGLDIDVASGKLYWGNAATDSIYQSNLDGSGITTVVTGLDYPWDVVVDELSGTLLWADADEPPNSRVQQAPLADFSSISTIIAAGSHHTAIALDNDNGHIYIANAFDWNIQRANLDGTGLITLLTGIPHPHGIAVDPIEGKLYWVAKDAGIIQRSNLDGTEVEVLISGLFSPGQVTFVPLLNDTFAPIQETTHTDAPLTRIGTSSTLPPEISIDNNGDGNLSGLGSASNLNGSVDTGTDGRFVGGGTSISLPDHTSTSVPITYTPTTHSVDTSTFTVDYSNGSADGTNQAEAVQVEVTGQGVGPTYESNPTPGSTLDFGAVVIGSSSTMPLDITNSSIDPNGGDSTLTDLTLLSAVIAGPDAAEFALIGFVPGTVLSQMELINLLIEFSPGFGPGSKDATLTFLTDEGAAFGSPGLSFSYSLQGAATPEPASMLGFAVVGLVGVLMWRRKRPMSKHYQ